MQKKADIKFFVFEVIGSPLVPLNFLCRPSVYSAFPEIYFSKWGPVDPKFILSYLL